MGCEHHTIRDSECVATNAFSTSRRHTSAEIFDFEADFIFAPHMSTLDHTSAPFGTSFAHGFRHVLLR